MVANIGNTGSLLLIPKYRPTKNPEYIRCNPTSVISEAICRYLKREGDHKNIGPVPGNIDVHIGDSGVISVLFYVIYQLPEQQTDFW